ncbi:M23 family metallopeptidase, partial [candidate division WOR-3 bacterium]|nr:M23 family metallopeptidase [candidate division WOR-3 bacterium]
MSVRPARGNGRSCVRFLVWPLLAVVVFGASLLLRRCRSTAGGPASPEAVTVDTSVIETRRFEGGRLAQGELFGQLLSRMGVDDSLRVGIEAALESAGFEFHSLQPGDSVTLVLEDSSLVALRYHLDPACSYDVTVRPGPARAVMVSAAVDTHLVAFAGTVAASLWQSMADAGVEPQLIEYFCEVLRHQVRFPGTVEPGDTFGFAVERLEVAGEFYRHADILLARYAGRSASGVAFLYRPDSGSGFYVDPGGRSLARLLDFPPVEHARRTSDFGPRMHPFRRRVINHSGLDYAASFGTPVRVVANGFVTRRGWYGGYGRTVDVEHDVGGLSSRYAHLCRYAPDTRVG